MESDRNICISFYLAVKYLLSSIRKKFPISISLIENPVYSPDANADELEISNICYQNLIDYVDYLMGKQRDEEQYNSIYIGDSFDVYESSTSGDYSYYVGWLLDTDITSVPFGFPDKTVAILYMQSGHPEVYPDRVIFYDPNYQIEVSADSQYIEIYQVVPKVYKMFTNLNENQRINDIRHFLTNTDRPRLDRPGYFKHDLI